MTPSEPRNSFLRWLHAPSVWIIAGLLIIGFMLVHWIGKMGGPQVFSERFGKVAPLVTVPVHIIVAVTPFPSDAIAIANGSLYGLVPGIGLNWVGWWIAALLEFQLGRRTRHDFEWDQQRERLPRLFQRLPVDHPLFLIGARQVPWLGGHVTTFLPGAAGVSWHRFWWCAAVGIVPSSILMASIGAGLVKLVT
jgi:uncharacterized membrane protein YdjX (TVP38/TMEM64 family)